MEADFINNYDENATLHVVPVGSIALTLSASFLSICGGSLIIFVYIVVQTDDYRGQIRRFLVYLTLSDIMVALGNFMGTIRYISIHCNTNVTTAVLASRCENADNLCVLQSALNTFGSLCSFFWIVTIGVHLLLVIRHQSSFTFDIRVRILLHVINWGLPGN